MKNLEKGAVTNSILLPNQSRVFARFLQRKFLHRRSVAKVGQTFSYLSRKGIRAGQNSSSPYSNATTIRQAPSSPPAHKHLQYSRALLLQNLSA